MYGQGQGISQSRKSNYQRSNYENCYADLQKERESKRQYPQDYDPEFVTNMSYARGAQLRRPTSEVPGTKRQRVGANGPARYTTPTFDDDDSSEMYPRNKSWRLSAYEDCVNNDESDVDNYDEMNQLSDADDSQFYVGLGGRGKITRAADDGSIYSREFDETSDTELYGEGEYDEDENETYQSPYVRMAQQRSQARPQQPRPRQLQYCPPAIQTTRSDPNPYAKMWNSWSQRVPAVPPPPKPKQNPKERSVGIFISLCVDRVKRSVTEWAELLKRTNGGYGSLKAETEQKRGSMKPLSWETWNTLRKMHKETADFVLPFREELVPASRTGLAHWLIQSVPSLQSNHNMMVQMLTGKQLRYVVVMSVHGNPPVAPESKWLDSNFDASGNPICLKEGKSKKAYDTDWNLLQFPSAMTSQPCFNSIASILLDRPIYNGCMIIPACWSDSVDIPTTIPPPLCLTTISSLPPPLPDTLTPPAPTTPTTTPPASAPVPAPVTAPAAAAAAISSAAAPPKEPPKSLALMLKMTRAAPPPQPPPLVPAPLLVFDSPPDALKKTLKEHFLRPFCPPILTY